MFITINGENRKNALLLSKKWTLEVEKNHQKCLKTQK